jgi:hypothetical protein
MPCRARASQFDAKVRSRGGDYVLLENRLSRFITLNILMRIFPHFASVMVLPTARCLSITSSSSRTVFDDPNSSEWCKAHLAKAMFAAASAP